MLCMKIPCHNNNSGLINSDYIYLISYKIAKKRQTPLEEFALLKNDITTAEPAFGIANILQIHAIQP